jgi:ubiquinone/menaquinone biosynthesis C-methylase UbiE
MFRTAQAVRVAWFFGQYRLATRLSGPALSPGQRPDGLVLPTARDVLGRLATLLERDLANIESGVYRLPYDLIPDPRRALAQAAAFFGDGPAVARRRRAGRTTEVRETPWPGSHALPDYYRQNFHFQTDGYLSDHSARLYDHQVEVLFAGGADAMRRQALVPVAGHLRTRALAGCRLLDVATGTGRFLTFVRDNYPRLDVTGIDLSHAYLGEAARRLASWRRPVRLVQADARSLPLADAGFDIVTCIFLFHELPPDERRRVAAEMARVLRPGGIVVFMDSLQLGDDAELDGLLTLFPLTWHEPFFADYSRDDLTALFAAAGLRQRPVPPAFSSPPAFLSKVVVFEKSQ